MTADFGNPDTQSTSPGLFSMTPSPYDVVPGVENCERFGVHAGGSARYDCEGTRMYAHPSYEGGTPIPEFSTPCGVDSVSRMDVPYSCTASVCGSRTVMFANCGSGIAGAPS